MSLSASVWDIKMFCDSVGSSETPQGSGGLTSSAGRVCLYQSESITTCEASVSQVETWERLTEESPASVISCSRLSQAYWYYTLNPLHFVLPQKVPSVSCLVQLTVGLASANIVKSGAKIVQLVLAAEFAGHQESCIPSCGQVAGP